MGERLAVCYDVHYDGDRAKACAVVFETGFEEQTVSRYCVHVKPESDYVSGQFYKRELPCILSVHKEIRETPTLAIIDGFVTLDGSKRGLGGHLYLALGGKMPVIGVAKTFYRGCTRYMKVYRGVSRRPLFVTCCGMELPHAASFVKSLRGQNRVPDVLAEVDHLTRLP